MEGKARISGDVLARYAADSAKEIPGVRGVVEGSFHRHRGVRVTRQNGSVSVELHLAVDWGTPIPEAGRAVQERVAEYLERMADVRPIVVDVVVDEIEGS